MRLEAIKRSKRPGKKIIKYIPVIYLCILECVFVEWDEGEHSIVQEKLVKLIGSAGAA